MIVIDSLTNIVGTKRDDAESVSDHLMGDQALTLQNGLIKLVPFCKRNKILLIATSQMRANLNAGSHGPKEKMAAQFATKHAFEYFVSIKRAGAAEDKVDIEGKTFTEESGKDARDEKLLTGHKIFAKLEANSIGPAGRAGVFTMDYEKGIINQHEELFWLGYNTGVIKLTGKTYTIGTQNFVGKKEAALALKDEKLAEYVVSEVKKLDEKL
jgi:RecA/RadA recombinase